MGMTIDKAIPKIQFVRNALNDDTEIAKAYDLAISTMRKYQKIEQIIRNYDVAWEFHSMRTTIDEIREVVEDGQNTIKD